MEVYISLLEQSTLFAGGRLGHGQAQGPLPPPGRRSPVPRNRTPDKFAGLGLPDGLASNRNEKIAISVKWTNEHM